MAHWMEEPPEGSELDGSFCYWNHDGEPLKPSSAAAAKGFTGGAGGKLISRAPS